MSNLFYSFFSPSSIRQLHPLFASVSENLPSTWSTFYFFFSSILLFLPIGLYHCTFVISMTESNILILIYFFISFFSSSVMVRWIIILAPSLSIFSGIGFSVFLTSNVKFLVRGPIHISENTQQLSNLKKIVSSSVVVILFLILLQVFSHSLWAFSRLYPHPNFPIFKNSEGKLI